MKGHAGLSGPGRPGRAAPGDRVQSGAVDVSVAAKPRPRSELLLRALRPLTDALVGLLGRTGIDPQALVLAHATIGALAALLVAAGPATWLWAALLLQLKTLLDNLDGGVARATGRVTHMGRYLDTVLDLLVNVALFAALSLHGPGPWAYPLAALAALVLMLVLSLDFILERRYKSLRGSDAGPGDDLPIGAPAPLYRLVRGVYELVLAPQDRVLERLDRGLFRRVAGLEEDEAALDVRLAWSDLFSTGTLVNLGLSTQLLVLGLCLVLGVPFAYVYFVLASGLYVLAVQALRAWRFRLYLEAAA